MDYPDRRPPRAARPGQPQSNQSHADPQSFSRPHSQYQQPQYQQPGEAARGVSFQNVERGDRHGSTLHSQRQRTTKSPYVNNNDPESPDLADPSRILRKKSLVRPDREKIEPGHRQWHYRNHVANLENEDPGRVGVRPSSAHSSFFSFSFSNSRFPYFSNGQLSSARASSTRAFSPWS